MPTEQHKSREDKDEPKAPSPRVVERTEEDPAIERGERLEAGKEIARAGKEGGKVPGADSAPE